MPFKIAALQTLMNNFKDKFETIYREFKTRLAGAEKDRAWDEFIDDIKEWARRKG